MSTFEEFQNRLGEPAFLCSVVNAVLVRMVKAHMLEWCNTGVRSTSVAIKCFTLQTPGSDCMPGDHRFDLLGKKFTMATQNADLMDEKALYSLVKEKFGDYSRAYFYLTEPIVQAKNIDLLSVFDGLTTIAKRYNFEIICNELPLQQRPREASLEEIFEAVKNVIF